MSNKEYIVIFSRVSREFSKLCPDGIMRWGCDVIHINGFIVGEKYLEFVPASIACDDFKPGLHSYYIEPNEEIKSRAIFFDKEDENNFNLGCQELGIDILEAKDLAARIIVNDFIKYKDSILIGEKEE